MKPMSTMPTDYESLSKRAAGRYRYNRLRQFRATMRLVEVVALLKDFGLGRGSQPQIAERLGVHRSTICRDMAKLRRWRHGGREAEDRHLADKRMQQYVRAEDRAELESVEAGRSCEVA